MKLKWKEKYNVASVPAVFFVLTPILGSFVAINYLFYKLQKNVEEFLNAVKK